MFTIKKILAFLKKYPDLPVLFVSYEDILKSPRKEIERLANFVGLRVTPDKLESGEEFVIPRDKIRRHKSIGKIKEYLVLARRILELLQKCIKNPLKIQEYTSEALRKKIL